jgi:hypothetical protein
MMIKNMIELNLLVIMIIFGDLLGFAIIVVSIWVIKGVIGSYFQEIIVMIIFNSVTLFDVVIVSFMII